MPSLRGVDTLGSELPDQMTSKNQLQQINVLTQTAQVQVADLCRIFYEQILTHKVTFKLHLCDYLAAELMVKLLET